MNYKPLGKSDVKISELVLGCWELGGDYWGNYDQSTAVGYIHKAFEVGINTYDTAENYGEGFSETVLGNALSDLPRDQINIITKIWPSHMSKELVASTCEEQMKRLKTDYLDTYFLHYPSREVPFEETMEEMMKLKKAGKIRSIGVSNFNLKQLQEITQYGDIDVIQPCYNLLWRFIDRDNILQFCIDHQIAVIPYSPLAQGLLTGAIGRDSKLAEDQKRKNTPLWQPEWFNKALDVTDAVTKVAKKYGKTTAQTALCWLISNPGITAPIIGVANNDQVVENTKALGWKMEQEDFDYLNEVSKNFAYQLPRYHTMFTTRLMDDDE